MRILIVTGTLPPAWCGVGDHAARLAAALARRGHDVAVLTAEGKPPSAAVSIVRVRSWSAWRTLAILRQIVRWRPDVVHFQYPTRGYYKRSAPWLLPSLCWLARIPVVQTWHEPPGGFVAEIPNALVPGGVIVVRHGHVEKMTRFYRALTRWKTFRFIEISSTIPFLELAADERARIRAELVKPGERLLAFFGFAFSHKQVEQLFDVADPSRDVVLFIGELDDADSYQRSIRALAQQRRGVVTGYVSAERAANLLAAADAVVFPFRDGVDTWNSSVRGAVGQGTFVVATSATRRGYDAGENVFYAAPNDLGAMRDALQMYAGRRRPADVAEFERQWDAIAAAHVAFYRAFV